MKTSDLLKMCVQNLRRRKFRTFLTVIGVIIGSAAIISMVSLGIGMKQSSDKLISSRGDLSIIDIYGSKEGFKLNDQALAEIGAMEEVEAVSPFVYSYQVIDDGNIYAGKNDRYETYIWNLVGVYPDVIDSFGYTFSQGGVPKSASSKKFPLIFGSEVAYQFTDTKRSMRDNQVHPFPDDVTGEIPDPFFDPLNETLKMVFKYYPGNDWSDDNAKTIDYEAYVTGVLTGDDKNYSETKMNIYIDVKDMQKIAEDVAKAKKTKVNRTDGYNEAKVKVSDIKNVASVQKILEDDYGLYTHSLEKERQDALKETMNIQIILGGLGGVSLIVAAISIANTMVMSVYERTREIGIMKVLGCLVEDIRNMFLIEAALIGFFGGVIGVGFSYIISFIINTFGSVLTSGGGMGGGFGNMGRMAMGGFGMEEATKLSVIPIWLVFAGIAFATVVGVLAGLYPANRAVKISALEAIKQD